MASHPRNNGIMTIGAVLLPASGKTADEQDPQAQPSTLASPYDLEYTDASPTHTFDQVRTAGKVESNGAPIAIEPMPDQSQHPAMTTTNLPSEDTTQNSTLQDSIGSGPVAPSSQTLPETDSNKPSEGMLSSTNPEEEHKHTSTPGVIDEHTESDLKFHRRPESMVMAPLTHPNGTFMFPGISTLEQDEMSREALFEAEDTIVADSEEASTIGDGRSDAGYESDNVTSGSTSMASSIRDYMYENGRRYHRFREGSYNFPNDDVEQEREDMKHAMIKLLCNQKLHFAPIGEHPQEILDIGTGTGIWAIEMGDLYSSANILGIDLSPIQPDWLPPNVKFMVDDVESPWLHPSNHFDYIHTRHTVMAIRDWQRLFRRSLEHLKPGGWFEMQEIHHKPHSATRNTTVPPEHPIAKYWQLVTDGLKELGVNFHAAAGGHLADMMREAGFINVTERVFHVPLGAWPKNKVLKTVGLYWRTILMDGMQAIALGPITRGLKWNQEQVEMLLIDVRKAYLHNNILMYMPCHIVYGQKPEYV